MEQMHYNSIYKINVNLKLHVQSFKFVNTYCINILYKMIYKKEIFLSLGWGIIYCFQALPYAWFCIQALLTVVLICSSK